MDRLRTLFLQIREFLTALPPARRASFVGLSVAVLAATFGLLLWVQRPQYTVLLGKLDATDAAAVVDYLKGAKIPYRIADDGTTIEVAKSQLYEARMALAARGLPQGGAIGFEIFDKQTLGMTDFVQRLDFQRALQGELARTIMTLSAVESARVHLALPERSLFVGEERRPSASVVLKLAPGRSLTPQQVDGVANLVASSVERLTPDDVTIVDVSGQVLSGDRARSRERGPADAMRAYQTEIEQVYVERIETLLERALGPGHAVARVTATLDLAQVERTEELVDPERSAVKSERRNVESSATTVASGAPGVNQTLSNETGGARDDGPSSQREDATVSYEVSRITSRSVQPMGAIRRLSVAVLIDGAPKGGDAKEFVPRPPEELERYKELIKRVVGFSEERGDQIEVVSAPFENPIPEALEAPGMLSRLSDWSDDIWRVAGILLFLVLSLTVVRPFLLAMVERTPAPAPATPELVAAVEQVALPQPSDFTRDVTEIARANPQQTAMIIRQWVEAERLS